MPPKRSSSGTSARATSTTSKLSSKSSPDDTEFDFDERVEAQVDWSIWRAIRRDELRLAVKCKSCGRWLTSRTSKANHRGRRCASKAVGNG